VSDVCEASEKRCGDGNTDTPQEQCDDGNDIDTDTCNSQCETPDPSVC
jgi:cysteine-rich repeat protein